MSLTNPSPLTYPPPQADGDGKLDIYEIARAFRAMGLPKRDGSKMDVDKQMVRRPISTTTSGGANPCLFCLLPANPGRFDTQPRSSNPSTPTAMAL